MVLLPMRKSNLVYPPIFTTCLLRFRQPFVPSLVTFGPERTTGRFGQCLLRLYALVSDYDKFRLGVSTNPINVSLQSVRPRIARPFMPANSAITLRVARFDRGELTRKVLLSLRTCSCVQVAIYPSACEGPPGQIFKEDLFLESTVHLSSVYTCNRCPGSTSTLNE
ncbi:hypothetical protein PgNI_05342 [Pyricularia grisea]|uniref:Uncharacterized protein n=1 Tax=Pyricularia grisea TaxID=148305 RepID=A0A6P8B7U9_PYRGI|nr:hypothetical protein PgNI_05342 [Pyricularia grisea]TLD11323.1 hypothetical protein PgNI_05342 [Pyricularia grisea]